MTHAREQIADIIDVNVDDSIYGLEYGHHDAADAILAAMPDIVRGMVKPLEWDENPDRGEGGFIAHSIIGTYHASTDGWSIHRGMKWHDAHDEQAAKAAANTHHAAQVLKALGL